jgi:hypothetical protein
LAKGVIIILLALAQNLFKNKDNNNNDKDGNNAFVSPLPPSPPLPSRRRVGSGVGC